MLTLADIARAVNGRIVGHSVRAPSPGHSNADDGMSIKLAPGAPDGFLVHLFNGSGEAEELAAKDFIRERLGLPAWEPEHKPMNGRVEETIRRISARAKPKSKITATYDYKTADGALMYQVVREAPKSFKQRRPRPGGGGWINNRGDTPAVLYRLPELLRFPDASVFFCEGEADADRVAGLDLTATTVSGDAADRWTPELAEPLRDRDVFILRDNDVVGLKRATAAARALYGVAKSVRVVLLPDLPPKGDVSDWLKAGHTKAELESICVAAPVWQPAGETPASPEENQSSRFTFTEFGKITWSAEVEHLVRGILPKAGLVVIYGAPKCGKSFWCFDIVMHVARGHDYRDRDVVAGTVVYLAAEGGTGFRKRVEAYRRRHDCSQVQFYLCTDRPDLGTDAPAIIADIKRLVGDERPDIVVIDTLNRTLVGSENRPEDMARYLRAAATIEDTFNCCTVVIHHCGVEKSRPRGHTSLTAAADVQIVVERSGNGDVVAKVELAKDAPDGDEIISRLDVVELGEDERGNKITTCVIVPVEGLGLRQKAKPLPDQVERAKRALANMICDHGEENANMPAGFRGVTEETWRQECYRLGIGGPHQDSMRKAFGRNKEGLTRLEIVGTSRGWYWLARP
jgi:hypothetical protein